jgi:hypothetical protein
MMPTSPETAVDTETPISNTRMSRDAVAPSVQIAAAAAPVVLVIELP